MNILEQEKNDFKEIWRRIRKKDFSGNTGQAIKNSFAQFTSSVIFKIGSLLFTAIIARMLLPELFGLYSLALSTIVFITAFSDLGIGTTLIRFVSKELCKKKGNPEAYVRYLLKLRIYLILLASGILLMFSYYIANYYYKQPIFLALLSGSLYLAIFSLLSFYSMLFQSVNRFEVNVYKELLFQGSRIILVPLAILLFISSSREILLLSIFVAIILSYFVALLYLLMKKPRLNFTNLLLKKEKHNILKLIFPLSLTLILTTTLSYVDIIVIGKFVEISYVGYYSSALTLIGAAVSLLGFSAALFPLFSGLDKSKLKSATKKSFLIIVPFTLFVSLLVFIFSKEIVLLVYGKDFLPALLILRILSLLLVIDPFINLYSNYHLILGNQLYLAKSIFFIILLDIILSLIFVMQGLKYSQDLAVIGAALSLVLSKGTYLLLLIFKKKD